MTIQHLWVPFVYGSLLMQTNKEIETILHCSFKNYKKFSQAFYPAISENKSITPRAKYICSINIWYFRYYLDWLCSNVLFCPIWNVFSIYFNHWNNITDQKKLRTFQ